MRFCTFIRSTTLLTPTTPRGTSPLMGFIATIPMEASSNTYSQTVLIPLSMLFRHCPSQICLFDRFISMSGCGQSHLRLVTLSHGAGPTCLPSYGCCQVTALTMVRSAASCHQIPVVLKLGSRCRHRGCRIEGTLMYVSAFLVIALVRVKGTYWHDPVCEQSTAHAPGLYLFAVLYDLLCTL